MDDEGQEDKRARSGRAEGGRPRTGLGRADGLCRPHSRMAVDGCAAPEQNVADCSLPIIPQHALSANAACNCWQIGSADVSGTLVKGNSSAFWPRTLRQWSESA